MGFDLWRLFYYVLTLRYCVLVVLFYCFDIEVCWVLVICCFVWLWVVLFCGCDFSAVVFFVVDWISLMRLC